MGLRVITENFNCFVCLCVSAVWVHHTCRWIHYKGVHCMSTTLMSCSNEFNFNSISSFLCCVCSFSPVHLPVPHLKLPVQVVVSHHSSFIVFCLSILNPFDRLSSFCCLFVCVCGCIHIVLVYCFMLLLFVRGCTTVDMIENTKTQTQKARQYYT